MSICLLSIADTNGDAHKACDMLSSEFRVEQAKIEVKQGQLLGAIKYIRQDLPSSTIPFELLLQNSGFDVKFLLTKYKSIVILSDNLIPIELISVDDIDIGRKIAISHVISDSLEGLIDHGRKCLTEEQLLLERLVLLPITNVPHGFPRIEQDLIISILKLSDRISTDILLNPSTELSLRQFNRADVQILHVDTHSTPKAIQLGPDRNMLSPLDDFDLPITVPVVFLVACSTAKDANAIGQNLVKNGARTVWGAFFDWGTGSFTDDITTPDVYDTLYEAILSGKTIGESFMLAKRKMVPSLSNAGQILLGNQFIRFHFS